MVVAPSTVILTECSGLVGVDTESDLTARQGRQ